MINPLAGLDPKFAAALKALLADCAGAGVIMKPYFGLRDPVSQARLWRQSRLASEIAHKRADLAAQGCSFLVHCLDAAGPQSGPWATNALPGLSWHQWGLAIDCVWMRAGKGTFDVSVDLANNGYRIYAGRAPLHGLTSLAGIGDHDHVQLPAEGSPLHRYALREIDAAMAAKFATAPGA